MAYKVPFVDPKKNYQLIKDEIDAAYNDVMSNGDLINRHQLTDFEKNLAKFTGTKYAIGVNSGYDALQLSVLLLGIGDGDEVIVPAHTFVASASAIANHGAKPVLVDVCWDQNVDVTKIEEAITEKTKAIMPVHLNGLIADMDAVMAIAEKHNLTVIEDACQSLGGSLNGRKAGSIGNVGCWSFYPFKILGGYGDGGAITTNDENLAKMATYMRYNGENRATGEYHGHGYTCLLDNIQAAWLDIKLRHLPDWIVRRREIAEKYKAGLENVGDLTLPNVDDPKVHHIYQNYVITTEKRDELRTFLTENSIETLYHWPKPYYKHAALKLEDRGFPITEKLSDQVVSLPCNVEISDEEIAYVIEKVRAFYQAK